MIFEEKTTRTKETKTLILNQHRTSSLPAKSENWHGEHKQFTNPSKSPSCKAYSTVPPVEPLF